MLHGTTLSDPWHWLRDTSYPVVDDPDVLAYVKAENAWFEAAMKPHEGLVETLFQEMKGRIKEEDASVPPVPAIGSRPTIRAGRRKHESPHPGRGHKIGRAHV